MKTAVEWLEEELSTLLPLKESLTVTDYLIKRKYIIEKAKVMEKEQAIDFGEEIIDHLCYGAQPRSWVEEKYNEIFK